MSNDLPFSCKCGAVHGVIHEATQRNGDRVVCHCADCQALAHYCDAGDRVLDQFGGTDLYQSRCASMELHAGADKLASLHLTDKPTMRWHTTCCRTPMFNTYANGRIPYVTTLLGNCRETDLDAVLGPPLGHLFVEDSPRDPGDVPRLSMARLMRRFLGRMTKDVVSGNRRRSALFDGETLTPIAAPTRLTAEQRAALNQTPAV